MANILFLQWTHLSESHNGASMYEHNMAKWLQSKGHLVQAMCHNLRVDSGMFDDVPYSNYSHKDRLIDWADIIITTPGKVRHPIPLKEIIYIQHNTNREPWSLAHGKVIYCAKHVKDKIQYECKQDAVLWPFNRYMDTDPLPPCYDGKVTLINCNMNKGGNFLKRLAMELPDVQFLGIHAGYGPQITHALPNIEYRSGELDLRKVLRDTSLLIMPSEKEGLPTLALEAMALGIPFLINDIPAGHELGANLATYKAFSTHIKASLSCLPKERENSLSLARFHAHVHTAQLEEVGSWFS